MIKGVEEGLVIYRQKLREYAEFTDGLKDKYGANRLEEEGAMAVLSGSDYRDLMRWTASFNGMEAVLGLSEEEVGAIDAEIPKKYPYKSNATSSVNTQTQAR